MSGGADREMFKGREIYRVWRDVTTRWADNDAYGHVNNVVHYGWFDTAVNGWLIDEGLLDVAAGDPIGLVVETGCRYARPLSYPEPVEIGLAVEHIGTSSVRYRIGIFAKGSEQAAAEGHFVHVYVGREGRRPVALPSVWRERFESIKSPL
ncbi:acyl-CoA thioesterase [Sphingosinicella rhizophila]|uniref:Thioesterase family protein n=1 Tax=Sphingosinicella rhizophila TaxID=3050082 RepID=A0ABU3Q338_9SPHN|nr:thioesterase family protein [Sphingosinicella sp. GR2756]MDT9597821.1 thioesterase family protein [Sphingosinicella sp. GR2756]